MHDALEAFADRMRERATSHRGRCRDEPHHRTHWSARCQRLRHRPAPPSRTHAWAQVLHRLPLTTTDSAASPCRTPSSHEPSMTATLEVLRVCTDGTPNACSKLYGAVRRAAREMGYRKVITLHPCRRIGSITRGSRMVRGRHDTRRLLGSAEPAARRSPPDRTEDEVVSMTTGGLDD